MARKTKFFKAEAVPFWALVVFLTLAFLTGGGSRADIDSLLLLRPAALIFCGIGLWTLRWEQVRANSVYFGMVAAIMALVLIHLVPLPYSLWTSLPGREIVIAVDRAAELGQLSRPISMVPSATLNALFSIFVPLAVLILAVQIRAEDKYKLIPVLLGLGGLSGLLGVFQAIGDPTGFLYFYEVTNNGSAVGLFANRNHQAMLIATLFPMLAVYASSRIQSAEQAGIRAWVSIGAGVALVPLLLVTGSRSGLLVGLVGLLGASHIYRTPQHIAPKKRRGSTPILWWVAGLGGVFFLTTISFLASRAEALQRLLLSSQSEDRFLVWEPIARSGWKYFPFGSGIGSFAEVYQIDEPDALLSASYFNHAHNDWLEVFLTAGLPGLALLAVAAIWFVRNLIPIFFLHPTEARTQTLPKLGAVIILILMIGSVGDYPLRVPSLACLFVLASLWVGQGNGRRKKLIDVTDGTG